MLNEKSWRLCPQFSFLSNPDPEMEYDLVIKHLYLCLSFPKKAFFQERASRLSEFGERKKKVSTTLAAEMGCGCWSQTVNRFRKYPRPLGRIVGARADQSSLKETIILNYGLTQWKTLEIIDLFAIFDYYCLLAFKERLRIGRSSLPDAFNLPTPFLL